MTRNSNSREAKPNSQVSVKMSWKLNWKLELGVVLLTFCALNLFPILFFGFLLPLYIFRWGVSILGKLRRSDLVEILPFRNSVWVEDFFEKKETLGTISVICILGGSVTLDEVKDSVRDKLLESGKYPQLKYTIAKSWGYPFWRRIPDFSIEDYVKEIKEPIGEEKIGSICETLCRKPWNPTKSGWRVHVVSNYIEKSTSKSQTKSCAIFLLHHAFGDAKSAEVLFLKELAELKNGSNPTLIYPEDFPQRELNIHFPISSLYHSVREALRVFDKNSFKIEDSSLISKERDISYAGDDQALDCTALERIAKVKNVPLLALEAAGITGGIRRFMERGGGKELDKDFHLIWTYSCAGHNEKLANYHSDVFFKLPIGSQDMNKRISKVSQCIQEQKESTLPEANLLRLMILGGLPGPTIKKLFKILPPSGIMINITAPDESVYFRGKPVENIRFSCGPLPGTLGLYFFILRYMNSIRIGVGMSKNLVKSNFGSKELLQDVLNEFTEIAKCK